MISISRTEFREHYVGEIIQIKSSIFEKEYYLIFIKEKINKKNYMISIINKNKIQPDCNSKMIGKDYYLKYIYDFWWLFEID